MRELPEEVQAEVFLFTHAFLRDHGYPAYEVSNFARSPEHRSRHNQKYWHHIPYLGLGPSAHSFSGTHRWWNERKLGPYEKRIENGERPVAGSEELTRTDLALEALMLGLRTADGIDLDQFRKQYYVDIQGQNSKLIEKFILEGLVEDRQDKLILTMAGLTIADSLVPRFRLTATPQQDPTTPKP
jgi:coproporphyrinogen III oxidase-like Fe-S oxidoreductase